MVSCVCNIPTSWHQVSHRHHGALRWCPVSPTYQQVDIKSHTDITAHWDGVLCLQHTNKLASSLTETSWRTQMVSSVCNIPTSRHQVSHRHHGALRWCPVSATYQQVGIKSHTDITAHWDGVLCLQHTNKLASSLTETSWRTQMVSSVCNIPTSRHQVSHRHHGALRWCPVSATYQEVDLKSHTDSLVIVAWFLVLCYMPPSSTTFEHRTNFIFRSMSQMRWQMAL